MSPVSDEALVSVRNLRTVFDIDGKTAPAVDGVSFDIRRGEVLGIVGESGSGKSVTALSILRLIPSPPGRIERGQIWFEGQDLLQADLAVMRRIRGRKISMIFQEPMTSLNPVFTIGMQVMETLREHENLSESEAYARALQVLEQVGIPAAKSRMKDYPHQFSGGMRQRVMIAMALACNPLPMIADEPTTALDVTIQAQILDLMLALKASRPEAALLLITHDLAVVAETCDRVIVMYGGKIQEIGKVAEIFADPRHPYTLGLMNSLPRLDRKGQRLQPIPGIVPSLLDLPPGCKFSTRCSEVFARCEVEEPPLHEVRAGHLVRCHLAEPAQVAIGGDGDPLVAPEGA
ncbi:MAG TPA: ABC transporter ATP-binding protein [Candidatus Udaeobacter sp.]|nr:ABC transporter ATP-binding protein [Candidatus Udaeobacter sp.]